MPAHVKGSVYAGPASKPEGLDALKKAVAGQPRMREIILYCGCCPWDKMPEHPPGLHLAARHGLHKCQSDDGPDQPQKQTGSNKGYPTDKQTDTPVMAIQLPLE